MWAENFVFLLLFGICSAYNAKNIDTESATILQNPEPGNTDNLFGYSVALGKNRGGQTYVYVGAPHDRTHGNVFSCRIANKKCERIDGEYD